MMFPMFAVASDGCLEADHVFTAAISLTKVTGVGLPTIAMLGVH
jgi:hypothetical protein